MLTERPVGLVRAIGARRKPIRSETNPRQDRNQRQLMKGLGIVDVLGRTKNPATQVLQHTYRHLVEPRWLRLITGRRRMPNRPSLTATKLAGGLERKGSLGQLNRMAPVDPTPRNGWFLRWPSLQ